MRFTDYTRPIVAFTATIVLTCVAGITACTSTPTDSPMGAVAETQPAARAPAAPDDSPDGSEAGILENLVQLTHADRFHKAGEAYFSPDEKRIVFQAIEKPAHGTEPAEFYAMYVADLRIDDAGRITALRNIRQISPPGSANTCGWFDPMDANVVYFGSTLVPPTASAPPGYNRKSGRYKWMFPAEMQIVRTNIASATVTLEPVVDDPTAYCAEGALSPDGRHLVYCSLATGEGDLYVRDLSTGKTAMVVGKPGYDGGPFFSPDGKRICYRSDRHGNHLLQLFVADLAFDDGGSVTGIKREYQLTVNSHVNWAPFWHPNARHLIYTTSEMGHRNYEVYLIDADSGDLEGSTGSVRYGTRKRRITHADRADVLPVFNGDGTRMLWTSQRGESGRSQLWVADFVIDVDPPQESGQ